MTVITLILAVSVSAPVHYPSSVEGIWRSPVGNSIMRIAPCNQRLCGTIVWATDNASRASRRTTPRLVGTKLLTDLEHGTDGTWRGTLFIPDMNVHVTAKIHRKSDRELDVSGCLVICKSAVWTAFTQPLPRNTSPDSLIAFWPASACEDFPTKIVLTPAPHGLLTNCVHF